MPPKTLLVLKLNYFNKSFFFNSIFLRREIQKCKSERNEWTKRWNKIDELCNRNEAALIANSSENISTAIDNS